MARPQLGVLPANPSSSAPGDAVSKGTAGHNSALDDHVHAREAYGSAAGTVTQGNDSRLSDSRAPNGAAGGDLAGTYPNPTIGAAKVTYAKIQNVSATDKLLGRSTAGAGSVEEIALTSAGRALIDDADATAQRTTLGVAYGASGDMTAEDFGSTVSAGAIGKVSDAGHRHAMPNSTAGPDADITVDAAGAAGTVNTTARAAHGHKVATDSTAQADTTPLAGGTAGTSGTLARGQHTHQSPGGIASITANQATSGTTEKQLMVATIPANFCTATTTFRLTCFVNAVNGGSVSGSTTFNVRFGTTTLTGNIPCTVAMATTNGSAAGGYWVDALVSIRTTGGSGTCIGQLRVAVDSTTLANAPYVGMSKTTATVVIDTTAQKLLELTAVAATNLNLTAYNGLVEVGRM